MVYSLQDQFVALTGPIQLSLIFFGAFLRTLLAAVLSFDVRTLVSPSKLRDRGFARGFGKVAAGFKQYEADVAVPALVAQAAGRVLELGPGLGNQVSYFNMRRVERVFGVEPNAALLPALRAEVSRVGVKDRYVVVEAGMEDFAALERAGIRDGQLDCVLSLQVLCTVPQPKEVVQKLYRLLKPGGKLIVWEHVACKDPVHWALQWLWGPFWSFALRGCTLGRPIDQWLINAGEWDDIQLEWTSDQGSLLPRVGGYMTKAKNPTS